MENKIIQPAISPLRIVVSIKTCTGYGFNEDGTIDLVNALPRLDLRKYKKTGENNIFQFYELYKKYQQK